MQTRERFKSRARKLKKPLHTIKRGVAKANKELPFGIARVIRDKFERHKERHTSLGFQYVLADSISFLNSHDWNAIANAASPFLSIEYLRTIEQFSPENTVQRYAIAYQRGVPVVIIACQLAEVSGLNFTQTTGRLKRKLADKYSEKLLVCGNLVSSGLDGVAFANGFNGENGWRIVAEILYKIRNGERLDGPIDFVLVKDIKGSRIDASEVVERYSYRRIATDPDMVLTLPEGTASFNDYLATLTSKYRSRIKKIMKAIDGTGYQCQRLALSPELDRELHLLYLNVENKSATRLATLPEGYFFGLSQALGEKFHCYGIVKENHIAGFITVITTGVKAIAYYVGVDYEANAKMPVYFRLLQLVIECAIENGCHEISFGRTALEPKANLGAKPVKTWVWARHRVPVVNFVIRQLFRNIPYEEAPERSVTKGG